MSIATKIADEIFEGLTRVKTSASKIDMFDVQRAMGRGPANIDIKKSITRPPVKYTPQQRAALEKELGDGAIKPVNFTLFEQGLELAGNLFNRSAKPQSLAKFENLPINTEVFDLAGNTLPSVKQDGTIASPQNVADASAAQSQSLLDILRSQNERLDALTSAITTGFLLKNAVAPSGSTSGNVTVNPVINVEPTPINVQPATIAPVIKVEPTPINVSAKSPSVVVSPTPVNVHNNFQPMADAVSSLNENLGKMSDNLSSIKENGGKLAAIETERHEYETKPQDIRDLDGESVANLSPRDAQTIKNASEARIATDTNNFTLSDVDLNDLFGNLPDITGLFKNPTLSEVAKEFTGK